MARNGDCLGELALPSVDDEVFLALADRSRRIALYYLRWCGRVDVEELADVVAGWRGAYRRGAVSRADRDRLRTTLAEQHLPLLADAGLVEVDEAAGTVAIVPLAEPVESLIDFAYETEDTSDRRY